MSRARTLLLAAPVAALLGYLAMHALLRAGAEHRPPLTPAPSRSQRPVPSSPGAGSAAGRRAIATSRPAPSGWLDGIPVGFARSQSGAVAAAGNYLTVLARSLVPGAAWSWTQAIRALTIPPLSPRAAAGSAQSAQVAARLAPAGSSLYLGSWLLGYRIWSYSPERARISVWNVGVMTSTVGVVPPTYSTTACVLRWIDGDWKISDASVTAGPIPPSSAAINQAQATAFTAAAGQFHSYRDVP